MPNYVAPPNPLKGWTPDDVKRLLSAEGDLGMHAVGRALSALYERQTASEQSSMDTKEWNGVGFSAFDGHIMSSMAVFYRERGYLTEKQLAFLRSGTKKRPAPRIHRYAKQLADIANANCEAAILQAEIAGEVLEDA
jgi:hypothetical protein